MWGKKSNVTKITENRPVYKKFDDFQKIQYYRAAQ